MRLRSRLTAALAIAKDALPTARTSRTVVVVPSFADSPILRAQNFERGFLNVTGTRTSATAKPQGAGGDTANTQAVIGDFELYPSGGAGPQVAFKASEPNDLGVEQRKLFVGFCRELSKWTAVASALVFGVSVIPSLVRTGTDVSGGRRAAGSLALVSLTALIIGYSL